MPQQHAFSRFRRVAATLSCLTTLASQYLYPSELWAEAELPKLTIAAILPLSGAQAPFGREAMRGLELAHDVLRQKNPRLAAHITIKAGDDKSSTHTAASIAAELIERERAHILIGSISGPSTTAIADVARRTKHPLISPFTTQDALVTDARIFRSCFDESMQGEILAEFALTKLQATRAAALSDGSLASEAMIAAFAAHVTARGGKLIAHQTLTNQAETYPAELKKLAATNPQVVFAPLSYTTAAEIMRQSKAAGLKAPLLGTDAWDTATLSKLAGPQAKGHYFVTHFAVDDSDQETKDFIEAFQKKYRRAPGVIAALSFDSFNLVVDALTRANSTQPEALRKALIKTSLLNGASGVLSLSEDGSFTKSGIIKKLYPEARFEARISLSTPSPP